VFSLVLSSICVSCSSLPYSARWWPVVFLSSWLEQVLGVRGWWRDEEVWGWNDALLGNCISLYLYRKYIIWRERPMANGLVAETEWAGEVVTFVVRNCLKYLYFIDLEFGKTFLFSHHASDLKCIQYTRRFDSLAVPPSYGDWLSYWHISCSDFNIGWDLTRSPWPLSTTSATTETSLV